MDASTLYDAIVPVCPIVGTSVGDPNNRATWSYAPTDTATAPQKTAADNVIATIPAETKATSLLTADFLGRWTNAEYLKLEQKRAADITANKVGNAKNWDIVVADSTINMTKQKTQSLKADLVTDGILTQARADEIFK